MGRQSAKKIEIDTNLRCKRVYPVEGSSKSVDELKTVGIKLSRDEAIHLARVLLAASQDWTDMDLTAYRTKPRKSDKTYQLTVTSYRT